jgi:hypothetical protein
VLDVDAIEVIVPMVAGTYEETDPGLSYTGPWSSASAPAFSGGSMLYTNNPAAVASFAFSGNAFRFIRNLGPNRGVMEVCVDGSCQPVDNYSPVYLAQQWVTFAGLADGVHSVTIANTSGAYLDVDALEIIALTPLGAGSYEQAAPELDYAGNWKLGSHPSFSGGSSRYTSDPRAEVLFRFDGTGLTILRTKGPNRGVMELCIDGTCQPVNNYNLTYQFQQPFTVTGLSAGAHHVEIHGPAALYGDLDALTVVP